MAELSKQALKVANNTEFPNNNAGLITPSNLRGFNVDMIDSLVDEITYNADSASWNQQIDALETFTASTAVSITNLNESSASQQISIDALNVFSASASGLNTGSLLITASAISNVITFTKGDASTFNVTVADTTDLSSLNAFTASAAISITNLNASSASQQVSINALNSFTASQSTASLVTSINNLNQFSASALVSISNINSTTASLNTAVGSLNLFTSSTNTSIVNINSATQSLFTSASLALVTASFNNGTRNLTFTKGDASTFTVNIPDVSGSAGDFVTTASFNAYTSSTNQRVSSLEAATSSYVTSAITASSIITASVNNDDITFTKGDGSQFTIQVATGSFALSASYAETASYAQFATDIYLNAKNTTGAQLNKGTVVRIIGATGDNALIQTASWENDNNSANTLGFLYENIANDGFGKVITQGTLLGIDTDPVLGYAAGQVLYLSSSGQYTNVKPPAPYHEVRLGQVLRAQQNNGSVYVLIQNGYELEELHDVDINTGSLANNNLLAYNSATSQWENKTLTQVGAATTGSNTFIGNQIISGNLAVAGTLTAYTASFVAVTSSVILGGNTILLNTFTPAVRYGGIEVIDSGSSGLTGSLLWDSQNDVWLYVNPSGSAYVSAKFISGPKSLTLGSEPSLTQNRIPKADDGDHIVDSQISDDGTTVTVANAFSASTFVGLGNLTTYSQSVSDRLTNIESTTASLNTSVTNLNSATASLFTSASLGLTTASVNLNTITFTKGDGTTFPLIVNTGSAATINTGSFATTGSNQFVGDQTTTGYFSGSAIQGPQGTFDTLNAGTGTITTLNAGTVTISGSAAVDLAVVGTMVVTGSTAAARTTITSGSVTVTNSPFFSIINPGNGIFSGFGGTQFQQIALENDEGTIILSVDANGSYIRDYNPTLGDYSNAIKFQPYSNYGIGQIQVLRNLQITGSLGISGNLTSSLQQGYVWVGNASGITTTVPTSSFGGGGAAFPFTGSAQISGSLGVTGSVSGFVNTLAISSNTASMNFNDGNFFRLQLVSGSTTHLTATNIRPGQTINLLVLTDSGSAGASGSLTFSPEFKFAGGFDYTPTAITASQDLVSFVTFDTTQVLAASVKNLL